MVGQVGTRQPLGRAGRVALGDPVGVLPAECRERDDPRVEPDVADLEDPLDRLAARLTADPDPVDPRAPQLRQVVERVEGALRQLCFRTNDVQLTARARVERQRQAVVAAPRDVPVAHVAQPVVHALAHVLGHPLDLRVLLEQLRTDLVDADEPVVREPVDDGRVAAPAVRVGMDVRAGLDEEAPLGEVADDLVGRLDRREAVQPAVVVVETSALVDRREHGKAERAAELEVVRTGSGRDVDDAGSLLLLEVDLVPRDDAVLDAGARREVVEGALVAEPDELGSLHAAHERVVRVPGREHPLAVLAQAVLALGMDGGRDIGGQRPGRGRPDDERLAGRSSSGRRT